jgi:SAM-dependent methyltransferase
MTDHISRVTAVFDDWATQGRAEGMERGHGPAARRAFDLLEISAGERYLDIGCGNGYTVRWAHGAGAEAIGFDAAPEMIARATAAAPECRFEVVRFPEHPLEPSTIDAIFSMEVFYYLPSVAAGMREAFELLAPGGRFACIVDFYRENEASHSWATDLDLPLALLSQAEWRDTAAAAGFENIHQQRLLAAHAPGEARTWKHEQGSLLTLAHKPRA